MRSTFFGSSWAMTTFLSFLSGAERGYMHWDVLATMGVLVPVVSKYTQTRVTVVTDRLSASEGRTAPVADNDTSVGSVVNVATSIDAEKFLELLLNAAALF